MSLCISKYDHVHVPHNLTLDDLHGLAALNVVLCHFIKVSYPTIVHDRHPNPLDNTP
jgi:phage tail protein X